MWQKINRFYWSSAKINIIVEINHICEKGVIHRQFLIFFLCILYAAVYENM